ncbi:PSME3-interacting protein [Anthonomus grandis grandis]|uniref:PSME3-interacting protein n=1 Tax=Anthonomus grandis grandis TaxID=2921223 RepID=UPI0021662FDE|nr:PSME3-interacting protein [Anthonomus grandis grandis]
MSSGFISEAEAVEIRKRRQEEWERVRKPSDPVERPVEQFDGRCLFERLQEQKQKKDLEYEEAHKLKNMIKGLDDDEVEFLDLVDRTKLAADRKKEIEEERELRDYRNRVAILQEKTVEERLQAEKVANNKPKPRSGKFNQQKLLAGIIVKKPENNKRKMESSPPVNNGKEDGDKSNGLEPVAKQPKATEQGDNSASSSSESIESAQNNFSSALKCYALLPGWGHYGNSSSDDTSSDSDNSDVEPSAGTYDLLGRKIKDKLTTKAGEK